MNAAGSHARRARPHTPPFTPSHALLRPPQHQPQYVDLYPGGAGSLYTCVTPHFAAVGCCRVLAAVGCWLLSDAGCCRVLAAVGYSTTSESAVGAGSSLSEHRGNSRETGTPMEPP